MSQVLLFFCRPLINPSFSPERFDYQANSTTDQLSGAIQVLLLPWLQYLGSSLGLLELPMNGWHPEWIPISSDHGGVDIGMYRLMRMLRFFDLRMKSFDRFDIFGGLIVLVSLFVFGKTFSFVYILSCIYYFDVDRYGFFFSS